MSAVYAFQINVTALLYHEILIGTMKTKDNKVNRLFMDMLRPPGTQHGKNFIAQFYISKDYIQLCKLLDRMCWRDLLFLVTSKKQHERSHIVISSCSAVAILLCDFIQCNVRGLQMSKYVT